MIPEKGLGVDVVMLVEAFVDREAEEAGVESAKRRHEAKIHFFLMNSQPSLTFRRSVLGRRIRGSVWLEEDGRLRAVSKGRTQEAVSSIGSARVRICCVLGPTDELEGCMSRCLRGGVDSDNRPESSRCARDGAICPMSYPRP